MVQRLLVIVSLLGLTSWTASANAAGERDGIGVRGGIAQDPGQLVIGGQLEVGPVMGPALFVPSLDLQFADGPTLLTVNTDLRWYLLPLPDTGIYFYGAGGPGMTLAEGDVGLGVSLAAGAHIPMRAGRRYNVEARFGFGDVPDFKFLMAVVWGL
jgi:hypothetical protein